MTKSIKEVMIKEVKPTIKILPNALKIELQGINHQIADAVNSGEEIPANSPLLTRKKELEAQLA